MFRVLAGAFGHVVYSAQTEVMTRTSAVRMLPSVAGNLTSRSFNRSLLKFMPVPNREA